MLGEGSWERAAGTTCLSRALVTYWVRHVAAWSERVARRDHVPLPPCAQAGSNVRFSMEAPGSPASGACRDEQLLWPCHIYSNCPASQRRSATSAALVPFQPYITYQVATYVEVAEGKRCPDAALLRQRPRATNGRSKCAKIQMQQLSALADLPVGCGPGRALTSLRMGTDECDSAGHAMAAPDARFVEARRSLQGEEFFADSIVSLAKKGLSAAKGALGLGGTVGPAPAPPGGNWCADGECDRRYMFSCMAVEQEGGSTPQRTQGNSECADSPDNTPGTTPQRTAQRCTPLRHTRARRKPRCIAPPR